MSGRAKLGPDSGACSLRWLPLLRVQRDLLDLPPGRERFGAYLLAMRDGEGGLKLPLSGFNPMSKPHVAGLLDALLQGGAEQAGEEAMHDAERQLALPDQQPALPDQQLARPDQQLARPDQVAGTRVGLVVADDARGGWTNRWLFEVTHLFEAKYDVEHRWLVILLWSSDPPSLERLQNEVRAGVFRRAWIATRGPARTLEQCLRQEGLAARFAGVREAAPAAEEQKILKAHLETIQHPTRIACLYGDRAAAACGYDALGLSERAGLRFAAMPSFLGSADPKQELTR